jgi:hypothetical protein
LRSEEEQEKVEGSVVESREGSEGEMRQGESGSENNELIGIERLSS